VPWQREQSLRPALTTKKGSLGIAWPEALQRLQLRTGSLTRTSPFPRHTGHALLSIGLPAQNPQVLDEYADITSKNTLQHQKAPQASEGLFWPLVSDSENRIYVLALAFPEQTSQRSELDLNLSGCQLFSASLRRSTSRCARFRCTGALVIAGRWIINCNAPSYAEWASAIRTLRRSGSSLRRMASAARLIAHCNLDKTSCSYLVSSESLALAKPKLVADCCCIL